MSINLSELFANMMSAASGAAKGHAGDLKNYLEARATLIAQGVAAIARDRAAGIMTDDDVQFAFDEIKATASSGLSAVKATAKAAAQDAVNAALNVAATAINAAFGTAIL
jgi:hypothetical protein